MAGGAKNMKRLIMRLKKIY